MNDEMTKTRKFTKIENLKKWLAELVFPGEPVDFIEVLEERETDTEKVLNVCFYTDEHQYFINATEQIDNDSYLGCQVNCRKPRPGEDWIRGNDLPDGKFNKETWNLILKAIVCYEIVILSRHRKPKEQ